MSTRTVEGPEIIQLIEDVIDREQRLHSTVSVVQHLLNLHSTGGLQLEPAMQVLQNLLAEITHVSSD